MARLNSGFGAGFSQQGTPVVKDGVMYITTGEQDIFALDAKTGNLIWEYRTPTDPKTPITKPSAAWRWAREWCSASNRTSGSRAPLGRSRRSRSRACSRSIRKTGKPLWKHELGEDVPKELRQYVAAPPLYYKGLVYISVSGGDGGLRGRLTAHDAKTGKEVWRWWACPARANSGSDTWEGESWKTGGGAMWVQPALDPDLGLIYVNTGNPWPDYNGSTRGGDNLFTCSIVALDAMTGKYRWHYQAVHHDLWDFDMPTPLILFDQTYNGQMRKALAAHSKQGWVYILDRVTGKPLIPVEEKPVPQEPRQKTAATQPIPGGRSHRAAVRRSREGIYERGCMFTPVWTDIEDRSALGIRRLGARRVRSAVRLSVLHDRSFDAQVQHHRPGFGTGDARVWLDHRARFADQQAGLAERSAVPCGIRQRRSGHGRRPAVPWRHGWIFPRLRFEDRRRAVAFSDRLRSRRAGGDLRNRRRAVCRDCRGRKPRRYKEARGDLVWSFKLGGRLNPLNGPPVPKPIVTTESAPNRAAEQ